MEEKLKTYKTIAITLAVILVGVGGFWAYNNIYKSSNGNQQEASCDNPSIKGNISSSDEKIYHMEGQMYYNKTQISPDKGEKMFCTEEEATKEGWRKSKR